MAARTDTERYDQALQYIRNINDPLATKINTAAGAHKAEYGKKISLKDGGYGMTGSKGQHAAVRALLLCQQVILKPPIAFADFATETTTTKSFFKSKSEDEVKAAIKCYTKKTGVTAEIFAQTAESIRNPSDTEPDYKTISRSGTKLGRNVVCFHAVKLWLFNSGLVTLRWMAKEATGLNANTANDLLGDGDEVDRADLDDIPRGHIFNFHGRKNGPGVDGKSLCHWGVSLGGGRAAASNTQASFEFGGVRRDTAFSSGGSLYGTFTLASSLAVCELKYAYPPSTDPAPDTMVIKHFDPTTRLYTV